jgi:hypothetical protein
VLDFEQIDLLVTDLDPLDHRLDGYASWEKSHESHVDEMMKN